MLAMPSAASAALHPGTGRYAQGGPQKHAAHRSVPGVTDGRRVDQRAIQVRVGLEQLAGVRPQRIDGVLRARVAFGGAVTQPDHPFGGVADMVCALLLGFCGNGAQRWVRAAHHRPPIRVGERGVEQLPHHGMGKVAIGLLDQQKVPVLRRVPQERVLVFIVPSCLCTRGILVQRPCLAHQVEAGIAQCHFFFQRRPVPDPFR